MQVARWGNSLAIRLPAAVVKALDLKEGDQVEISVRGGRDLEVARDGARDRQVEQAWEALRSLAVKVPPGWKFDREEIYAARDEQLAARFDK